MRRLGPQLRRVAAGAPGCSRRSARRRGRAPRAAPARAPAARSSRAARPAGFGLRSAPRAPGRPARCGGRRRRGRRPAAPPPRRPRRSDSIAHPLHRRRAAPARTRAPLTARSSPPRACQASRAPPAGAVHPLRGAARPLRLLLQQRRRQRGERAAALLVRPRRRERCLVLLQVADVEPPRAEVRLVHHPQVEGHAGVHAHDAQLARARASCARSPPRASGACTIELGQHRVVVEPHLVARRDPAVPAHAGAAGHLQQRDAAGGGEEAVRRGPRR